MSKTIDFYSLQKNMGKILSSKYKEKLYNTTKNVELGLRAGTSVGFLGLETDIGAGLRVGMGADDTMNTLSSCCLELFCELFWFLNC